MADKKKVPVTRGTHEVAEAVGEVFVGVAEYVAAVSARQLCNEKQAQVTWWQRRRRMAQCLSTMEQVNSASVYVKYFLDDVGKVD